MVVDTSWRPDPARRSANPAGSGGAAERHARSGWAADHPGPAPLGQVPAGRGLRVGPEVRRQVGVEVGLGDLLVEEEAVAQGPQLVRVIFLIWWVALRDSIAGPRSTP